MGKNNWIRMTILHRSPKTQIGLEILEKTHEVITVSSLL